MRKEIAFGYPFGWLDELAEVTLNPDKNRIEALTPETLSEIRERLPGELSRISTALKNQAFSLYSSEKIKVVAGQHDQAIQLLLQQMQINLAQYPEKGLLRDTARLLLDQLKEFSQNLQQRYRYPRAETPAEQPQLLYKVLCRLSVDQIAIILKAADDIKLVISRSFSQVLKSIVPFLSTERFLDFSWKSARSSTYKMEGTDKQIAIQVLEALISKIREYG
ncbi:hypothetical protein LX99_04823 [Mucilaginibacter oryzae]|uniref:Uncharacterized protein n=1 Tax=Mucilaginibacter oryzae TaxID=468058 RepID=A0A316GW77_9SPHI|nr:hypothetical protein [Mucilaginibacter oryzae]PWK68298.1 hypothetical protein LX99_04823 [Mucilaginibacter oryzae]